MSKDWSLRMDEVAAFAHRKPAAAPKGLNVETILITPEIAASWLDHNVANRNVSRGTVEIYAKDMLSGHWRLTGDAIRFDSNNHLIDGQHRLLACIKADRPFATTVIYGLPPETREVLDLGRKRSVADLLTYQGTTSYPQTMAAVARQLAFVKRGLKDTPIREPASELLALIDRHPRLGASITKVKSFTLRGLPPGAIAMVHYVGGVLLNKMDRADAMVEVMWRGIPDYPNDPMHHLRERILGGGDRKGEHMVSRMMTINLVHTWNHFAIRRPLAKFQTPKSGTSSFDGLDLGLI